MRCRSSRCPIFIFVFGIGSLSKVRAGVPGVPLPDLIINQPGSARRRPRAAVVGAEHGASRVEILRRIVVPATAPFIFAGFRVALPVAMIVVVITEMISSADGLGYQVILRAVFAQDRPHARARGRHRAARLAARRALVALRDRLVYWEKLETYYV